jgi:hypothetical protein
MNLNYFILTDSELSEVDFNDILESSENTLRWNLDHTKFIVKTGGDIPSWLEEKTNFSQEEMLNIISTADWTDNSGP